ncbi:MAG: PepSY domain-containing protein [Hyphomicrobiaceae bacterium]
MTLTASAEEAGTSSTSSLLYRAIWRWHFYAGLLALPFLVMMATTGGLYLFKDELNRVMYGSYILVEPAKTMPLPADDLVAKASASLPGSVRGFVPPSEPDRAAQVRIKTEAGEKMVVYVNPYDGKVIGQLSDGKFANSPFMFLMRKIHNLEYFGWFTNRIIEVVGGWAMILVVTGIYLWWPRQQSGGVVSIRGTAKRRVFWRDLHAVTGAFAAVFIFFLALTGMPWSGFWGAKLTAYSDQAGLGYPPQYWDDVPKSTVPMKEAMSQINWSLENAPMPVSMETGAPPIGLAKAIQIFDGLGIAKGYAVDLPSGPDGVYSASVYPDKIANEQIIHLDQYSGKALFNGGWAELGPVGKAIEWSVSVHMGQEFGRINQLLMLAACLAIILMAVAAGVMWWKRRPQGSLGAPRYPSDYRIPRGILLIALAFGLVFPLVGLSILIMLAIDLVLPRGLKERLA